MAALAGLAALVVVAACSTPLQPRSAADTTSAPTLGACYRLTPAATEKPSSDAAAVPCSSAHTAQTFAVGTLPKETGSDYRSSSHGRWVHSRCETAFEKYLAVDESLALRIQLSWAWFRPSERAWGKGARWYRCDLVGGTSQSASYRHLPANPKGLFSAEPPEQWLTCARGETVRTSTKVPCSETHDWRAVTTIKLGAPEDPYPGDRLVQVRTRNFCSDSVGAWMNYPVDYDFGYTWFHEAEWKAGVRRSVCWARAER